MFPELRRVQPRRWSGVVWHQCASIAEALWYPSPARVHGRYHTVGNDGAWYGSTSARGAWAELFRHWRRIDVDPFAVQRLVARVRINDLPVLDLTDGATRALVGVDYADLISEDWTTCQLISAAVVRSRRFKGILAPGGALHGTSTVVVYHRAANARIVEAQRVRSASGPYALFLDELIGPEYDYMREVYRRLQRRRALDDGRRRAP